MIVNSNHKIDKIIKFIEKSGNNGVFVTNSKREIIGIVTDGDIRKLFLENKISKKLKAKDIMNKNFLAISQQENIDDYYKILINSEKMIK